MYEQRLSPITIMYYLMTLAIIDTNNNKRMQPDKDNIKH